MPKEQREQGDRLVHLDWRRGVCSRKPRGGGIRKSGTLNGKATLKKVVQILLIHGFSGNMSG